MFYLRIKCLECPCEAFLCWSALFSLKLPPLIKERKWLRCARDRTDPEESQFNHVEEEIGKHTFYHKSAQRSPQDSRAHPV